jgi:hypothetical protein
MSTTPYEVQDPLLPEQDDQTRQIASIMSPERAENLVGPPPDSAPTSGPGESTPRTGNLARPPQQAVAKNLDTAAGRTSYSGGGLTAQFRQQAANYPPAQATSSSAPQMIARATNVTAPLMPANANNLQPAGSAQSATVPSGPVDTRQVVVKDLNKQPVASGPQNAIQAAQPAIVQALKERMNNNTSPSPQAAVQPAMPLDRLPRQQAFRMQAYNNSPAAAQYAASQAPVDPAMVSGGINTPLQPAGTQPAMPSGLPPASLQQANPPSQLDRDQARLDYLQNSGSGISQFQQRHPVVGGILRGLDVAGQVLTPGLEAALPGTTGHHLQDVAIQQQRVGNDQAQLQAAAQLADTQSQLDERLALAGKADRYDPNATKTVTTADGVMAFNPSTGRYDSKIGDAPDRLNKYQIITAGDGTMFRVDPADPTHAEPITGPDGKQLTGKQDSKYIQLERNGEEHTIEIGPGGKQTDLGPTGQKPMRVSLNSGTWALEEDKNGKPVLFNSKTGETKDAPDIQKSGTSAKAQAALDKVNEPIDGAMNYANDYVTNGRFTGSGDEALQEKFFELAKPSVGFRMTQPQIDLLQNSRSWMGSAAAHLRHATSGTWFSDEQRKEIVETMKDLAAAKKKGGSTKASPQTSGGFNWNDHPVVKP